MDLLKTFDPLAMIQPKRPEDIRALLAEFLAEAARLQAHLDKLGADLEGEPPQA